MYWWQSVAQLQVGTCSAYMSAAWACAWQLVLLLHAPIPFQGSSHKIEFWPQTLALVATQVFTIVLSSTHQVRQAQGRGALIWGEFLNQRTPYSLQSQT